MQALPPHIPKQIPPHYLYGRDAIDSDFSNTSVIEVISTPNKTPIFRVCGDKSPSYEYMINDCYKKWHEYIKPEKPIEEWVSKLTPKQEAEIAKLYEKANTTIKNMQKTEFDIKIEEVIKEYFKSKQK
jgi:uncharacterized protein (UPF0297 family)